MLNLSNLRDEVEKKLLVEQEKEKEYKKKINWKSNEYRKNMILHKNNFYMKFSI